MVHAQGRIRELDGWRGVSILLVLAHHAVVFAFPASVGRYKLWSHLFEVAGPLARTVAVRMDGKRATTLAGPPSSPTVRITLSAEHFIRLGCGREAPEQVLSAGEVAIDGDGALGAQIIEAMDFMI